tara:strand:- start:258 stop:584 length:327 start_codon:yes stop_codon:yes gene_type:complete
MGIGRNIVAGLLGVALAGCASSDEKYRGVHGVVEKGSYDGLAYDIAFHRSQTIIQLRGYGGEFNKTLLRIYAMDKDNDGDFDVKDIDNIDFNSEELKRIIGKARKRKD